MPGSFAARSIHTTESTSPLGGPSARATESRVRGRVGARRGAEREHQKGDLYDAPVRSAGRGRAGPAVPASVREPLEQALHTDFSAVVLRERSPVPVAVGALGLVRDLEVHLAPTVGPTEHPLARHILAHELVHLTQLTDGLDTRSIGGQRTAHCPALERDADLRAAQALRGGVPHRDGPLAAPRPARVAQCYRLDGRDVDLAGLSDSEIYGQPGLLDTALESRSMTRSAWDAAMQEVRAEQARRDLPAYIVPDAQIRYKPGDPGFEAKRSYRLNKPKHLYRSKTRSTPIASIPSNTAVEILEEPSGALRSWAKIRVRIGAEEVGYINTRDAIEGPTLEHNEAGVIMGVVPKVEDVKQHMFGTCFLFAALMSLTRHDPRAVREIFETDPRRPAKHHVLRFYHPPRSSRGAYSLETVKVDNTVLQTRTAVTTTTGAELPSGTNIGANGAWNWPALVEKAFAAWPGKQAGGDTLDAGSSNNAAAYLTGDAQTKTDITFGGPTPDATDPGFETRKRSIIAALWATRKTKKVFTANTHTDAPDAWKKKNADGGSGASKEPKVGGIAFRHVYEIVAADEDTITVRNPWGSYGRVNGRPDQNNPESVLTWPEFMTVFASWTQPT